VSYKWVRPSKEGRTAPEKHISAPVAVVRFAEKTLLNQMVDNGTTIVGLLGEIMKFGNWLEFDLGEIALICSTVVLCVGVVSISSCSMENAKTAAHSPQPPPSPDRSSAEINADMNAKGYVKIQSDQWVKANPEVLVERLAEK
jgi:hypothetical protein